METTFLAEGTETYTNLVKELNSLEEVKSDESMMLDFETYKTIRAVIQRTSLTVMEEQLQKFKTERQEAYKAAN